MSNRHILISDESAREWDDAVAYRDQIARNEAERNAPQPVITQCVLLAFSFSMFLLMLALFGTEPW